ncbi:MAG: methyltransferase domain-containing protein [Chitinophagaceae bacterium]|nr:methyltransferase domain-containing protein [Chitinophagaceae bacterium]
MIKDYDGRFPLSSWLKDFFRENKQMGSRDRKTVSELVYGYFRLGHNQYNSIEERILAALYSSNHLEELTEYFRSTHTSPEEFSTDRIFPWKDYLSEGIDADAFAASFLVQPDLYIRIRPGREKDVASKLDASGIQYLKCSDACIALPNSTKIDALLKLNEEVVIQDKSSQQTVRLLDNIPLRKVWDCCAASGGKSIMVHDLDNNVDLTVSDIRESIISNLKNRLKEAGIKNYNAFVADLTSPNNTLPDQQYDLIIADIPCTGSGTWSRTPEQLSFFKTEKIAHYTKLQRQIIRTAMTKLNAGGNLLYITCSVFKQENEEMVNIILSDEKIRLVRKELIKGYSEKADTMFAALFTNAQASE